MSNPTIAALIAKAYAALPIVLPGFKPREQQKMMIKRASAIFNKETVGLVEAPTGTGKSFGYLIPGIISAALTDKVLIISTAAASLQDQLAHKDIPAAIKAIESVSHEGTRISGVRVVVAKGRERYVCPVELDVAERKCGGLFSEEATKQTDEMVMRLHKRFESGEWDGVRDSLDENVPASLWRTITYNASSCPGRSCSEYEACPYYKVQEALKTATIIVTNHDYLLTCLARLPKSQLANSKAIYVFDEGHHLGDKLISCFARSLNFEKYWREEIEHVIAIAGADASMLTLANEDVRSLWNACSQAVGTMLGHERLHRFRLGYPPSQLMDLFQLLKVKIANLRTMITDSRDRLRRMESSQRQSGMLSITEIRYGKLLAEIDQALETVEDFTSDTKSARWIERGHHSLEIRCSPFDPAEKARMHLWPIIKTCLITSGTIAPLGKFEPTLFSLGLPATTPVLKLDSPFDFENQAKIYVPKLALDGNDPKHGRRVSAYLKDLSKEHQGVLVYFTSRKLMNECYEALPAHLKDLVLLQGQWQPSRMLAEHRRRIDDGQRSIIFGLDSIGEGVDLPGLYCTQVIITKLPFPTQDDPVITTHGEYLKETGKDPFNLLTLPVAGRKLAQVCGRLMRRETDYGEIMVLDKRLETKRYGARLIAGTQFKGLATI